MKEIKALQQTTYFSGLNESELKEIKKMMINEKYQREEIIFFEGEPGDGLCLLKKGKVKLTKMIESGKEQILKILQPGDVFAEVVLFDGGDYPATATAMEDTEIGILRTKDMERITNDFPEITFKLLKIMSKRLRRAQERIRNLGLKNTKGRTASLLVHLTEEHGGVNQSGVEINLGLTQEELANLIGTSRETVSRILSGFKQDGLVEVSRQKIIVKDLAGLKKLSG